MPHALEHLRQRRRQIGLLRAVGASPAQVRGRIVVESFLIGAVGSLLGLGLGFAVAWGGGAVTGSNYFGLTVVPLELALAWLAGRTSLPVLELLTVIVGFGTGLTFPVATISVQNAVDQAHLGVATGVLTFLRSLGSALGVAILGAIALGNGLPLGGEHMQASAAGVLPSLPFTYIFIACLITTILSLILFHFMPEKPLCGRAENEAMPVVE